MKMYVLIIYSFDSRHSLYANSSCSTLYVLNISMDRAYQRNICEKIWNVVACDCGTIKMDLCSLHTLGNGNICLHLFKKSTERSVLFFWSSHRMIQTGFPNPVYTFVLINFQLSAVCVGYYACPIIAYRD